MPLCRSVFEGVLRLLLGLTCVTLRLSGPALGFHPLVARGAADRLLDLALDLFLLALGLLVSRHVPHSKRRSTSVSALRVTGPICPKQCQRSTRSAPGSTRAVTGRTASTSPSAP